MRLMKQSNVLSKGDRIFSNDIEIIKNLIEIDKVFSVVNNHIKINRV